MGAVASMAARAGFQVRGSDNAVYDPMKTYLEKAGITFFSPYAADNLAPEPSLVVVGNAISRGNPEIEEVLNRRIPYMSLPEFLKTFFLNKTRNILITGTHGKTTTTAMTRHLFAESGYSPGYLVAGLVEGLEHPAGAGEETFILEADEYDTAFFDKRSKFLHYLPEQVLINNIEFDHADIFNSLDEILLSFRRMVNLIPSGGCLLINGDDHNCRKVAAGARCRVETFGFSETCDYVIQGGPHQFSVLNTAETLFKIEKPALTGRHNIMNTAAAGILAVKAGIGSQQIQKAAAGFRGVKRRMQLLHADGPLVYDDFAHHPTAIAATLQGLRETHPGRKITAVLEPRSNTMVRNFFQNSLPQAFSSADRVICAGLHREHLLKENEKLNLEDFREALEQQGIQAEIITEHEKIPGELYKVIKPEDIVIFLSNGGFSGIAQKVSAYYKVK